MTPDSFAADDEHNDVIDLDAAKEKIRQLQQVVRSLGGLEPVKGSQAVTNAADNPKNVIIDTSKFAGPALFMAIRKGQKLTLSIDDGGHVTDFKVAD